MRFLSSLLSSTAVCVMASPMAMTVAPVMKLVVFGAIRCQRAYMLHAASRVGCAAERRDLDCRERRGLPTRRDFPNASSVSLFYAGSKRRYKTLATRVRRGRKGADCARGGRLNPRLGPQCYKNELLVLAPSPRARAVEGPKQNALTPVSALRPAFAIADASLEAHTGVCFTRTPVWRFRPASCYEQLRFDL